VGTAVRATRFVLRVLLRSLFRVRVHGLEHLSAAAASGGFIVCGLPHRNWSEPALLHAFALAKVRLVTVADGQTVNTTAVRRAVSRVLGGVVAVGPVNGGTAREVIAAVVPVILAGTDELYLCGRIEIRVLPPIAAPRAERDSIAEWMVGFSALIRASADTLHDDATCNAPNRKRWRWLSGNYPRA